MILVTGASGLLGSALAAELAARGERVRVLVRHTALPGELARLSLESVPGDILDYPSLLAACRGADTVYHCAGLISLMPGGWEKMRRVNVDGTANVLRACREGSVRRLVHVSSIEALSGRDRPRLDDDTPFNPQGALLPYGRTKAFASNLVLEAVAAGLDAVIVSPTGIIGPGDHRPSRTGKLALLCARGRLPATVGGGFYFVDTRDVVHGVLLAAEKGRRGTNYILPGERASIAELMALAGRAAGRKPPRLSAPFPLAWLGSLFLEQYHALCGGTPLFTRSALRIIRYDPEIDAERAQRELGWSSRPLAVTVRDTVAWFREQGKL